MEQIWIRAAHYTGIELDRDQIDQLGRYRDWLIEEAITAGGIGPEEASRVDSRHLADSLVFATPLQKTGEIWDLGTGVGLPGVPLAIALPESDFTLIDRSGRRVDLLRRVIRILGLENCQVVHSEIDDLVGTARGIVSRATLPPPQLTPVMNRHLQPGGVAVVGGSWHTRPEYENWSTLEIPSEVLDQTVWLLIMRRQ